MEEIDRTQKRQARLKSVLMKRYKDLHLILEEIHNVHNISAILRTADGFGLQNINLVYSAEEVFKINPLVSQGVQKWMDINFFITLKEAVDSLKKENVKIYATGFKKEAVPFLEADFTIPCAIILGNEHEGVSQFACEISDEVIYIPMSGFAQSFNVSVANAIILSEARKQRLQKDIGGTYSEKEIEEYFKKWIKL